jgi:hypothetical protein
LADLPAGAQAAARSGGQDAGAGLPGPEEEKELLAQVFWPSHEPLAFLRRRGGFRRDCADYYEKYHRPENVKVLAKLLGKGGTHIIHFFKGMGLEREREEIERSIVLARLMREQGLPVSVYVGGTMHTDWFYKEVPEARQWACVAADGSPITYMDYQLWRHLPCINNQDYRRYMRRVLDAALDEFQADWVWFDNNILRAEPRSCRCAVCKKLFPQFVEKKYSAEQRRERFGYADVSGISPPDWSAAWHPDRLIEIKDPAIQEWIDFRCQSVYDFFVAMHSYIQVRKPGTVIALNIKGIHPHNLCFDNGIDHGRWKLPLVNSCDAGLHPHLSAKGSLLAEFRSFKISHSTALSIIDGHSDAGNLLGVVMNRQLETERYGCVPRIGQHMFTFGPLGRFLREHQDDLYGSRPIIADVAVLRSFPSMAYNCLNWRYGPFIAEQGLWEAHVPFAIIYDQNLDKLDGFRVLLLANQEALSDENVGRLVRFVESGGGLVATDRTGAYDDWRRERPRNALTEAFGIEVGGKPTRLAFGRGRVACIPRLVPQEDKTGAEARVSRGAHEQARPPKNWAELERALRWAAGGQFTFATRATRGVAVEYRQGPRPGDRAVHLMNFSGRPLRAPVRIRMATGGVPWTIRVLAPGVPARKPARIRPSGHALDCTVGGLDVYQVCVLSPEL